MKKNILVAVISSLFFASFSSAANAQYHTGNAHTGYSDNTDDSTSSGNWEPFGMVRDPYDKTYSYPSYSYQLPNNYGAVYPGAFNYSTTPTYYYPNYSYIPPARPNYFPTGYGVTYQYIW